MEFDLNGEHRRCAYKLLAGLMTPRLIAWVTTRDGNGVVNAAPFSFFNAFGTQPPVLGFAPGDKEPGVPKDTARNIRRTGEFVVNPAAYAPIGCMEVPSGYCRTKDRFQMPRPD